jgi:HEAT repeat protein
VLLETATAEPPGPKRLAAVRALGQGRVPGSLPVLTGFAADPDRETRMAAVEALGALGGDEAVPILLDRLGDPEWGLRVAAAKALAPFIDREAVRAALSAAAQGDADALVRKTAAGIVASPAGPPG